MATHTVRLYALSTCSHCRNARKLLDQYNLDYDCIEVDLTQGDERDTVVDEVKKYNPRLSFPTMVIDDGERVIVGFKEDEIKEALEL